MKRFRNILLAMCVLITSGALVFAFQQKRLVEGISSSNVLRKKQVQVEAEIISRVIDRDGLQHAIIEATKNMLPKEEVVKGFSDAEGILDTTALALGIQKKHIQNLTIINSTLAADNLRMKKQIDSASGATYYSYSDKFISAKFTPPTHPDTLGLLDFNYNADLGITQYYKRKWFLAPRKSYLDIYSKDPRASVNSVKRLVITEKEKNFEFRIQGSSTYDFSGSSFTAGPAVRLDVGRFSFQGLYGYSAINKTWSPFINANFDVIRF